MLEAINELHGSPDYELHRLTERSPEFFDETVGRHLESLAALQSEAETLAGEIEELTGGHCVVQRIHAVTENRGFWLRNVSGF